VPAVRVVVANSSQNQAPWTPADARTSAAPRSDRCPCSRGWTARATVTPSGHPPREGRTGFGGFRRRRHDALPFHRSALWTSGPPMGPVARLAAAFRTPNSYGAELVRRANGTPHRPQDPARGRVPNSLPGQCGTATGTARPAGRHV